jgi:hypothetical protein
MENKYITEMSKEELILPVTEEEITTAIASINKRKSADFHSLTIEHISSMLFDRASIIFTFSISF